MFYLIDSHLGRCQRLLCAWPGGARDSSVTMAVDGSVECEKSREGV